MGKTVVVTSGKGGVGKTTSAANIGSSLAMMGRRVLLVDTDIGLRNLDVALGVENRIVYDLVDVINGNCRLAQALVQISDYLYLLPAAQSRECINRERLELLIRSAAKEFDYVLVDSPAGIEDGFLTAISAADAAIIVAVPEISSIRDADRVSDILSVSNVKERYLLVNRFRASMAKKGESMSAADISELLELPLIGVVPEDVKVICMGNVGELAVRNRRCRAGSEFRKTAERLKNGTVILKKHRRTMRRRNDA